MKSNKNDNGFNNPWKEAFEKASVEPSAKVWANIEKELNSKKPRIVPFWYNVAATVLLLLIPIGIWQFGNWDSSNNSTSSNLPPKTPAPLAKNDDNSTPEIQFVDSTLVNFETLNKKRIPNLSVNSNLAEQAFDNLNQRLKNYSLADSFKVEGVFPLETIPALYDWEYPEGKSVLVKIKKRRKPKKKKKKQSSFFTSVSINSNLYEPNFRARPNSGYSRRYDIYNAVFSQSSDRGTLETTPVSDVFNENIVSQSASSVLSYSVGVGGGFILFKHWVVQSSLTYSRYRTIGSANYTVSNLGESLQFPLTVNSLPESIVDIPTINFVGDYELVNSFDYLNIPLETGIQFNTSRRTLLLKTGISADIFLQNTLIDRNNTFDKLTIKYGNDVIPYRKVSWSGIIGAEVELFSRDRLHLMINGQYRFALGNITLPNATFRSLPQSVNLGFNLRFTTSKP